MNKYMIFIILLSLLTLNAVSADSMFKQIEESIGPAFQMFKISPDAGEGKTYTVFSLPLWAKYTPSRYVTYSAQLNQGFQSFDGTGLYGLSNLNLNVRYLHSETMTIVGGVTVPIGSKNLKYDELTTISAGRIPFVNSPLDLASSGFGLNVGLSYGLQMSEAMSLAFGAAYFVRGSYTPVKDGSSYNPSDELLLAVGMEYGDKEVFAFIGDFQFSLYSEEKSDGAKLSDPGLGMALSGTCYFNSLKLRMLFYKRGESDLAFGGAFKPPSILSFKLNHQNILLPVLMPMIPYIGFEHTGEGSLVDSANLFLFGVYQEKHVMNGFPISPFLEISFGSTSGKTGLFGLKLGTNITFQMY